MAPSVTLTLREFTPSPRMRDMTMGGRYIPASNGRQCLKCGICALPLLNVSEQSACAVISFGYQALACPYGSPSGGSGARS